MNEQQQDTLSLLRTKQEHQSILHSKEMRNKIFQEKRQATIAQCRQLGNKQEFQLSELQKMLRSEETLELSLDCIINTIDNAEDQTEVISLLYAFGILHDIHALLIKSSNEFNLIKLTYILSYLMMDSDAGLAFVNLKGVQQLEVLLNSIQSPICIEYCLLSIGNLDKYEISQYFEMQVLPRLVDYLTKLNPLPSKTLTTVSWLIDKINYPIDQQNTLQALLIQTEDEDVIIEAIQHIKSNFNLNDNTLNTLCNRISTHNYVASSQIIDFICNNLKSGDSPDIIENIIKKAFLSGKVLLLKSAIRLARMLMVVSKQAFVTDYMNDKIISLMGTDSIRNCIMNYLETLLLTGPNIVFPIQFYVNFLDTLCQQHLKVLALLNRQNPCEIKKYYKLQHKYMLQQIGSSESREMINILN